MDLLKQKAYRKMLQDLISSFPHWGKLEGKDILISGASGMIGSLLIDTLMQHNEDLIPAKQCRIVAVSRSAEVARQRFAHWIGKDTFRFLSHDVAQPLDGLIESPELLIHAASTTHPAQYTAEPINTILANLLGTKNMLDIAMKTPGSRFLLLSSVEVYGENRGDADYFTESYCGYIDCNTLRAGYSEAKRVSEAMCQAYIREKDVDAVIIRLPRCYGPTMRMADTKALSQFIKKGLSGEDIVLKSEGKQFYSYAFAADVVLGMLYALNSGACGEAYNLADGRSDIALRELAALVAEIAGSKVVYELPSEAEQIGYSTATRAVMRGDKLNTLGWCPHYDIETGIKLTMRMLRDGI
jgi:nucleoside-diphosphate-sugar epimerase